MRERNIIELEIERGRQCKVIKAGGEEGKDFIGVELCSKEIREHLEMALQISETKSSIEDEIINEERVKQCLKKMKIKKAAGPDGIKPEFYKTFLESDTESK